MDLGQTVLGVVMLAVAVSALVFIIAVLLAIPVALYNKLRGGRFAVSRTARSVLMAGGLVLVIGGWYWLMVARPPETARAQVSEGIALTSQYKTVLAEYFDAHGSFNGVNIAELGGVLEGRFVSRVRIEAANGASLAVVAEFGMERTAAGIRGLEFRIATQDGGRTWQCGVAIADPRLRGTAQVEERYLPATCK
jgi:type IV pilus assembly protein PilA